MTQSSILQKGVASLTRLWVDRPEKRKKRGRKDIKRKKLTKKTTQKFLATYGTTMGKLLGQTTYEVTATHSNRNQIKVQKFGNWIKIVCIGILKIVYFR